MSAIETILAGRLRSHQRKRAGEQQKGPGGEHALQNLMSKTGLVFKAATETDTHEACSADQQLRGFRAPKAVGGAMQCRRRSAFRARPLPERKVVHEWAMWSKTPGGLG